MMSKMITQVDKNDILTCKISVLSICYHLLYHKTLFFSVRFVSLLNRSLKNIVHTHPFHETLNIKDDNICACFKFKHQKIHP